MCFYFNIIGQFHFLLWTPFFLKLFHVYARYMVDEVLIICFSNYYLLRFLSPYEYWSEVSLGDPKLCSQLSDVKNSFTNRDSIFETIILSTNNPMLSSKLNVLSHNSLQVVQIWKILHKQGLLFCRNCLEYQQSYVIFKI